MRATLALAFLLAVASPAFAFQCPGDMAAIDAALQTAQLSDADLAKVKELRAQGQQLHEAGQHQQSVDALAQAKTLLGI
jgi:hypothetical protein